MPFAQRSPQPPPEAPRTLNPHRLAGYLFITTMLLGASHPHLLAQQMTTQAPPAAAQDSVQPDQPQLPDDPSRYPDAEPAPPLTAHATAHILSDGPQTYHAGIVTLDDNVDITLGDRHVHADHITYDNNTGDITASGNLVVEGGKNGEHLTASHGTLNLRTGTGHFYDVTGSVGLKPSIGSRRVVYTNSNPFLFRGREVVKTGPAAYDIFDGEVTSCQLPHPDWLLRSAHFTVLDQKATARNSTFRLLDLPILYLPYVSHSVESDSRQSGFLIPSVGQSSTRGFIFGEQIYLTLGRSADLTVGAEYYSLRGFAQNATYRYRGHDLDFVNVRYSGLFDRRTGTSPTTGNQGGEDLLFAGRHDFSPATRVAANVEYLSSYIYREAFTDNFNQAITSDVISTAYGVHHHNGLELAALADRYQGIKLIAQNATATTAALPQQEIRIFHAPTLSFDSTEHRLPTGLTVSLQASASGLKRTQPNFTTSGIIERFDINPQLSLPLTLGTGGAAWRIRPSLAARETLYTRSRVPVPASRPPLESLDGLSRSSFDFALELRPPVLTRTFVPGHFTGILGTQLRHTIAPEFSYRLSTGIDNFNRVLRFDPVDIASNTHEAEYGITQRLYRRAHSQANCADAATIRDVDSGLNPSPTENTSPGSSTPDTDAAYPNPTQNCSAEELLSWRLTQKYFFDPHFGNAIVNGRRNLFTTTLALSGVSFLTEPREISPLISRLRVRTSAHTDLEWDFDLDTGARKFTSSNVFLDVHQGNAFAALSYARLDAPGRFYTQVVNDQTTTGVSSSVSDFNQLRLLLGYGNPAKRGLSIAGNTGLDLKSFTGTSSTGTATSVRVYPALIQYLAVQTAYNWNCCGVAFEYRQFQLGQVRNEPGYRFSFTLANVGTAGNLRRAERLF